MIQSLDIDYKSKDVVFIIPTKDRPYKIHNTLRSIAEQTVVCGRVIVVSSGQNIQNIINQFSNDLKIDYYECDPPGQIRQRNLGISKLDESTKLVGFLDDDILLKNNALEMMIGFWNQKEPETAGVGFNIISDSSVQPSAKRDLLKKFLRRLLPPGRILKSGLGTSFNNLEQSIRSDWLNGGTTIWKQEIICNAKHKEINVSWAINEDVIFSYPISRKFPLYVCKEAEAIHDHGIVPSNREKYYIRGRAWALWHLYFVSLHKNLSAFSYSLMILGRFLFGTTVVLFYSKDKQFIKYYLGILSGAGHGLWTLFNRRDFVALLEKTSP